MLEVVGADCICFLCLFDCNIIFGVDAVIRNFAGKSAACAVSFQYIFISYISVIFIGFHNSFKWHQVLVLPRGRGHQVFSSSAFFTICYILNYTINTLLQPH